MTLAELETIPVVEWATKPMPHFNGRAFADLSTVDVQHLCRLAILDVDKWAAMHRKALEAKPKPGANDYLLERVREDAWQHQVAFWRDFMSKPYGACLNDAGTGKTIIMMEMLHLRLKPGQRAMWVCPVQVFSTIMATANSERYANLRAIELTGSIKHRIRLLQYDRDLYIVNYEAFQSPDFANAVNARKFTVMVLDEGHRIKNFGDVSEINGKQWVRKVKQTDALMGIAKTVPSRWILTATPGKSPLHHFNLIRWLDLGARLGWDYLRFYNTYFTRNVYTKAVMPREELEAELNEKIKKAWSEISHRVKIEDCLDMPERNWIRRYVKLSQPELANYQRIAEEYLLMLDDTAKDITAKIAVLNYLRQAAGGGCYTGTGKDRRYSLAGTSKLDALAEIIDEYDGRQIVVACAFNGEIDAVSGMLKKAKVPHAFITGKTKGHELKKAVEDFRAGRVRVIVMQALKSEGLDGLQCARVMVHFSRSYSTDKNYQLEGRIFRGGDKTPAVYIDIVAVDANGNELIDAAILMAVKEGIEKMEDMVSLSRRFVK
jgi:superfamily II DNA or RNA helicase